jgi:DNA-binding transcriptional LysR family regulator
MKDQRGQEAGEEGLQERHIVLPARMRTAPGESGLIINARPALVDRAERPRRIRHLEREAYHVIVHSLTATHSLFEEVLRGNADVLVAPEGLLGARSRDMDSQTSPFLTAPLFEDWQVCVVSAKDRSIGSRLDRPTYLSKPHAAFALEERFHANLELATLADRRIQQRNRMLVSNFMLLPILAATGGCIALVPRRLALLFAERFELRLRNAASRSPYSAIVVVCRSRRRSPGAFRPRFRAGPVESPSQDNTPPPQRTKVSRAGPAPAFRAGRKRIAMARFLRVVKHTREGTMNGTLCRSARQRFVASGPGPSHPGAHGRQSLLHRGSALPTLVPPKPIG